MNSGRMEAMVAGAAVVGYRDIEGKSLSRAHGAMLQKHRFSGEASGTQGVVRSSRLLLS